MESAFMSVNNMKSLINIINDVFLKKYNYNLETSGLKLKNIFFNIMSKIQNDPENSSMLQIEKNKLTLKITKEIIKQELQIQSTNRDIEMYPDRKNVINEISSRNHRSFSNDDVNEKMNAIQNSRSHTPPSTQQLDIEVINETSFDEQEFKSKIDELESTRSVLDNKIQEIFPVGSKDFIEKRNEEVSAIINKDPCEVDPTSFYKQNELLCNNDPNIVPSTYQNIALSSVIPKNSSSDTNQILETKYILINSYDRNWIVDKYRYKYKVRFTYNTNEILRVPYYENNPAVPFTKTEKSNGIRNDFGWTDKNGVFRDPYDPSKDLSTTFDNNGKPVELGFEEIEIVVDQDASMMGTFKNIYSIQITNVTIPTEIFHLFINSFNIHDHNTSDYNFNFNFPYILCNIEEFKDVYDGTDDTIRKSFCQLQYDNFVKTPNGRGYIILKPVQSEIKTFYPTPLSVLPTLNISLTKPNGELLNLNQDGISIFNIAVHQTYYLKITTTAFFHKDAFYRGDYIRIKNFNMYQITNTITSHDIQLFNSFINKSEGHVIYEIGEPNENGYYNTFHIFAPGTFDEKIGKFNVDYNLTDTLSRFNQHLIDNYFYDTHQEGDSLSKDYENGYIINMSLQNSISMRIEMFKPDSKVLKIDPSFTQ